EVGVATGLAWTETGGDVLYIEATVMKGKGQLTLTGHLGDVMKESAHAALSYVRSRETLLGISPDIFSKTDIHIHVPAGAIPKDGPSAGITMATALASLLANIPVRRDVAMTGEVTLRGRVLAIGGLKEKILAAKRAKLSTVMSSRAARPSVSQLGEFRLIRHLRRRFRQTGRAVLRGIGDDAAVIRPSSGHALLLTTDLLAEGIHFDLRTATFEDIGYKAAVANLSDIAAMGGRPQYMLVAVAIHASRTSSDVDRLYRGMMRACRLPQVELVGGETSASRHGLFLSITLTGFVQAGRVLTRDGARVGDLLYVTG